MAKNVLIVSNAPGHACGHLRLIATRTRPLIQGSVSCYFGEDLVRLDLAVGGLAPAYIVLGLAPCSQQRESIGFAIEQKLLEYAIEQKATIGIVCDEPGRITAPHVKAAALDLVHFVVTNRANDGASPSDVYPNANTFIAGHDMDALAADVAAGIARRIVTHSRPMNEGLPRLQQLVASNTGWNNSQLTD